MSGLWPARLHHLRRDSADPAALARFYGALLGDEVEDLGSGQWLIRGPGRLLLVGKGTAASVPLFALEVQDAAQLATCRRSFERLGMSCEDAASPLLNAGAFCMTDPDGRRVLLGTAKSGGGVPGPGPAGRLQHFVCASTRLEEMMAFYRDRLGMPESDRVLEKDALSAAFLRSDPEHHSFAAFRAPESRADHHCYETTGWNDIRDWADHIAKLRIPLWWGPGRHGPGNNLFFMIEDPDGHKVEFSAELEIMTRAAPSRTWPHEERTLNLWGSAWMRS
jgi:catechol 2,3-dioxygenase